METGWIKASKVPRCVRNYFLMLPPMVCVIMGLCPMPSITQAWPPTMTFRQSFLLKSTSGIYRGSVVVSIEPFSICDIYFLHKVLWIQGAFKQISILYLHCMFTGTMFGELTTPQELRTWASLSGSWYCACFWHGSLSSPVLSRVSSHLERSLIILFRGVSSHLGRSLIILFRGSQVLWKDHLLFYIVYQVLWK